MCCHDAFELLLEDNDAKTQLFRVAIYYITTCLKVHQHRKIFRYTAVFPKGYSFRGSTVHVFQ